MSTMFSDWCRERMLWLAVSWLLVGSAVATRFRSLPCPNVCTKVRSYTCCIHSFGNLKAPANTGFYPGKTSPVKVRAFSQKLFIIAPFFYFAGTSRVFSNSTGLHISCNKITHLELMLSKAHDFNQEQN